VYTTERRTFASSSALVVDDPIGPIGVLFLTEFVKVVVFLDVVVDGMSHY